MEGSTGNRVSLTTYTTPSFAKRVYACAKREDRAVAAIIRRALADYLERSEKQ